MGFAPDGLVEGFYDPNAYDPEEGFCWDSNFILNERGEEFIKATIAYQKRVNSSIYVTKPLNMEEEMSLDTNTNTNKQELGIEQETEVDRRGLSNSHKFLLSEIEIKPGNTDPAKKFHEEDDVDHTIG
ncbi:hypothetical protein FNV43_RR24452 [Rhamnella rubrinervis]|uniref:Uncharacterized protein n=1 Tax=Rhamnella rubrinervis TaxID=2594499 RepID=A0A8K0DT35_9ROSA|nr:hypothetical protein FNV43_RR24452 [Rhamnella rubrinervis]